MAVSYRNWRGREVAVSDETLAAILAALGDYRPAAAPEDRVAGAAAPWPRRRGWGFTVQLYSVRSRESWGHGDLRDLADLAAWSGRELGADFVLVNPLHAAEPLAPVSPSPYLAMTRRYLSPLYLRIEDIPEYAALSAGDRARVDALGAPLRAASQTADLIDRDAVWTAKREALGIIRAAGLSGARQAELDAFRARGSEALEDWASNTTSRRRSAEGDVLLSADRSRQLAVSGYQSARRSGKEQRAHGDDRLRAEDGLDQFGHRRQ